MNVSSRELAQAAKVHIFDVDHTLTNRATGRRYALAGVKERIFYRRELFQLPFMYLKYRLGRLPLQSVTKEIRSLKGRTYEELSRLAHSTFEESIKGDIFPDARAHLAMCREVGVPIILASSSFDVILEPLRDHLAVDHMICSELAYEDNVATGWFVGGPCYAEVKAERIAYYLGTQGIAPADVAFYSDSFHDLPSLDLVGHPVAVNPDKLLELRARQDGWPIMQWRLAPPEG